MTTAIVSPHVRQLNTAVLPVPDLAANVRAAQAAGNFAYVLAEAVGDCPATSYHMTFVTEMRRLATPMPCACDFCREMAQ